MSFFKILAVPSLHTSQSSHSLKYLMVQIYFIDLSKILVIHTIKNNYPISKSNLPHVTSCSKNKSNRKMVPNASRLIMSYLHLGFSEEERKPWQPFYKKKKNRTTCKRGLEAQRLKAETIQRQSTYYHFIMRHQRRYTEVFISNSKHSQNYPTAIYINVDL